MNEYLCESLSYASKLVFTVTLYIWLVMGIVCMGSYIYRNARETK